MKTKKKHIFFVGPSGVGKTTIAKSVAEKLGFEFVDLDLEIINKVGCSISQYFVEVGEAQFRIIEREVLTEICQRENECCVATGGGSILDALNICAMKETGTIIFLNAQIKDIISRVENDATNDRPLLKGDLEKLVKERYLQRLAAYELAGDISIGTSKRSIEEVVDAVVRQYDRHSGNKVDIGSQIISGNNILHTIGNYLTSYSSVFVVTQELIPKQFLESLISGFEANNLKYKVIFIPEGEDGKSFSSYVNVINEMATNGASRSSCVLALGGGVVGDLSGYVASTFMRGVDLVQVPTTLLAQVDSSIGGKNGINLAAGKNLVGTITQAKLIFADAQCLVTLPEEDYLSGLGEVVKYALLGNATIFEMIKTDAKKILDRDGEVLAEIIRSCMNQKIHVVSRDPFERNGMRATLNLGHTLAHVIEKACDYKIAHGDCVSIGLRYVCELSFELEYISQEQRKNYLSLIDTLGLGLTFPEQARKVGAEQLVGWMLGDKKSSGESLNFVLLIQEGGAKLVNDVDPKIVVQVLEKFLDKDI